MCVDQCGVWMCTCVWGQYVYLSVLIQYVYLCGIIVCDCVGSVSVQCLYVYLWGVSVRT